MSKIVVLDNAHVSMWVYPERKMIHRDDLAGGMGQLLIGIENRGKTVTSRGAL
jgi:hypothetical protein